MQTLALIESIEKQNVRIVELGSKVAQADKQIQVSEKFNKNTVDKMNKDGGDVAMIDERDMDY